jgi:hypothetical protein
MTPNHRRGDGSVSFVAAMILTSQKNISHDQIVVQNINQMFRGCSATAETKSPQASSPQRRGGMHPCFTERKRLNETTKFQVPNHLLAVLERPARLLWMVRNVATFNFHRSSRVCISTLQHTLWSKEGMSWKGDHTRW